VVVLAEAEGLRWMLKRSRMAWTEASARRAEQIRPRHRLLLYVARGAFHNPTRDESHLIGLAEVASPVRRFRRPVELAGRRFVCGCDLRLEVVLPERRGAPVRPLVPELSFVRRKEVWGQYLRSGLVQVPTEDLDRMTDPRPEVGYLPRTWCEARRGGALPRGHGEARRRSTRVGLREPLGQRGSPASVNGRAADTRSRLERQASDALTRSSTGDPSALERRDDREVIARRGPRVVPERLATHEPLRQRG
jgi:hypothetical protein